MSRCNQSLLVSQCNILACFDSRNRRRNADHTDNGCQYDICFFHGGDFNQSVHARQHFHIQITDARF